jgi:uncharacterized protein (TIGR03437 family)
MFRKPHLLALMVIMAGASFAGTFGTVVPIGGEAADLALDESRGVLYIANFTANRIDVMTLATNKIQTSINLSGPPTSISMSPDNHWLLVAIYGAYLSTINNQSSQTNALVLIDLTSANAKQTFAIGNPPLGVAFGLDDQALVVTTEEFIVFNPALGTTQVLETIGQVVTNLIPQPPASFPSAFAQASVAASRDGLTIAGFGGTSPFLVFKYTVSNHTISAYLESSSPPGGPRVVSLADNGSVASMAWWMSDLNNPYSPFFPDIAEFTPPGVGTAPGGLLNLGSHVIDSSRNLVYAQISTATTQVGNTSTPILQILASDNLTLQEQLQLPENLAGKSVLTNDHNMMYAISDSGVTALPVGNLQAYPRLAASVEDVVFRGNFCDRSGTSQTFTISDPGGNSTPFTITSGTTGVSVSPSSGITPAVVTVTVDPSAFASQKGTVAVALSITSTNGVNPAQTVRVLINSMDPSQRGTFVDVPGTVVDVMADPKRNFYYVLRQDKNQVLIFNSANNTQTGTLRTCTRPKGMAITFDQQYLLIGCDGAQIMDEYDLDTLQAQPYIAMGSDYVQSVATSSNAILAGVRAGSGGPNTIDSVDLVHRTGGPLPTLGVWQNTFAASIPMALQGSSNGSSILIAIGDGSLMIYDANVGSFVASRHDFSSFAGGFAASNFGQYVVGNVLLDSSGAPVQNFSTANGSPSGFAFVNQTGYYTTAPATTAGSGQNNPGTIAQVNLSTGGMIQPTAMVEAPLLGNVTLGLGNCPGSQSTTQTNGTQTTTIVCSTTGGVTTITTTECSGSTSSSSCQTSIQIGPANSTVTGFIRSLAPLPNQTEFISLTTSGFTVLPWTYSAAVAPPQITKVVSAADGVSPVAPGGLMEVLGSLLAPTNLATSQIPLATALANSCLTVNGLPVPLVFVSPTQINAQMPSQAVGNVVMEVHTPGGVSDNFNLVVQPTAPAVFLSGVAGPETNLPTVILNANNLLATESNPIHRGDSLTIYFTGCGNTAPSVVDGLPAPSDPLAMAIAPPSVSLGGVGLSVSYGGLAPGQVGVCQINATVPGNTPEGLAVPLTVSQGGYAITVQMRVID